MVTHRDATASPRQLPRLPALRVAAPLELGQEREHVIRREMPQGDLADWSRRELPLDCLPVAARRQGFTLDAIARSQERRNMASGSADGST